MIFDISIYTGQKVDGGNNDDDGEDDDEEDGEDDEEEEAELSGGEYEAAIYELDFVGKAHAE